MNRIEQTDSVLHKKGEWLTVRDLLHMLTEFKDMQETRQEENILDAAVALETENHILRLKCVEHRDRDPTIVYLRTEYEPAGISEQSI